MKYLLISFCLLMATIMHAAGYVVAEETEQTLDDSREKLSYAIGMQIAESLKANDFDLDIDRLIQGLRDVYGGQEPLMSDREVMEVQRQAMAEQEEERARMREENLQRSREFLQENLQREEVRATDSGVQYELIEDGDGASPAADAVVEIHYVGRTTDGDVFDSSRERGEPAAFPLEGIVSGLSEGIQLMREGASYRFFLPPELAYGERGAGAAIGPNEALIFEVELIRILEND